ncbi:MAG: protein-tyrosine phosphatase family protein [Acidobacteriota bacterium]|nr:protein-tyrosine phosphatase family protein [Acidobacteriota bacterium]
MSIDDGQDRPMENSYWIRPGRFAAGEYPGHWDRAWAAEKVRKLLDAGIDHFIDLTEQGELEPYSGIIAGEARRRGLEIGWERHPIVDLNVPSSPQRMVKILDAVDAALGDGRTVYVHCWGGVGRTGTTVGCWLVRHGRTGGEALRRIAEWWRGMEKNDYHPISPETREQREYVRSWSEPSTASVTGRPGETQ